MDHILYLGGFCLPNKNAAAQRVLANAKIFRELGYDVTLVGLSHNSTTSFLFEGFQCVNLKYPSSFSSWIQMLCSIKQYERYIINNKTKIVVAYNHPSIALFRLYKYCKKHGVKLLSDCTEWYEPHGKFFFNIVKGLDVYERMNKIHPKLDGIITISRYLDDFYLKRGVKTLLLPPLVDKREAKWIIDKKVDNKEIIKLLYAGSPGGTKDRIDIVIESLAEIAKKGINFEFDIVGITKKQYENLYAKELSPISSSFTKFHGRLPHEQVIQMLLRADFQIFLREENLVTKAGFPTKFVETISSGTIVLTNASSNLKDFMLEGENSYELDITNKESLVNTLTIPMSLSKIEITQKCQRINSYTFDYRNYIEQTKHFIQSLYK